MRGFLYALMVAGVMASVPAHAIGPSDPISMELSQIQEIIEEGEFGKATELLWQYLDANPSDADAYNLLGFSYRKAWKFDLAKKSYDRALEIDPEHKGAHEYLGELYLQTGQPEQAEALLERLGEICGLGGCMEYEELRASIAAFRSGKTRSTW